MKNPSNFAYLLIAIMATMLGCAEKADDPQVAAHEAAAPEPAPEPVVEKIDGECGTVYEAEICTWAKTKDGELLAFGATIPLTLAENAPLDEEMIFPPITLARIPVPAVVSEQTGVDHLGINWEVGGHPPTTFFTPHFDFHFYTQSPEAIEAIDCSDLSKPEEPPEGYILPDITIPNMGTLIGLCVPHMGMHGVRQVEFEATELFSASMIIGYYANEIIFIEPMVAHATLTAREDFSLDMVALPSLGEGMSFPASFKASYDQEADAYHFVYKMDAPD